MAFLSPPPFPSLTKLPASSSSSLPLASPSPPFSLFFLTSPLPILTFLLAFCTYLFFYRPSFSPSPSFVFNPLSPSIFLYLPDLISRSLPLDSLFPSPPLFLHLTSILFSLPDPAGRSEGGYRHNKPCRHDKSPSRSNSEVISPEILKMRAALFCIFTYLDTKTLLRAAEVCRDWRFVARHPAVWTRVLLENARISSKVEDPGRTRGTTDQTHVHTTGGG